VLAGDVGAVALIGRAGVAVVGAGGVARLHRIGWAGGSAPRAGLGHVAVAGRRAAHGARRLEGIGGTVVARAVAGLGDVADARGRPTDGAGSALGVDGAGRADPRTGLGRVTDTRRSAADRAGVTGRVGTHPGAAHISSAHVALVGAARAIGDVVGLAGAAAVAGIGLVAVRAGARAAARPRGLEAVGGAGGVGAIAGLGYVALPGRGATDGTGVARVVHACRRAHGAVARVGRARIAVVRTRRAGRPDGVGGTARARPRAGLGAVALVDGRATDGARRLEGIGRARGAGAGTRLRHVAGAGRRTAHRARVTRIVHACRCTHGAVAQVRRAHVAVVGAARSRRLDRIGGTARARGRERDELADPGICRCLRTGRADGRL